MSNGLRIAAAVLAAIGLGWASLSHAFVTVTHARNPGFALNFDADDPVALVGQAQAQLAAEPSRKTALAAINASRRSIGELALNSAAFQLLGFAAQGFQSRENVGKRVIFSTRLSRRSLRAHLWLIEDAVGRNDVAGALHWYDMALRSNPSSQSLLFPVLTRAIDHAAVRRRFLPYMAAPPPWLQAFLRAALATSNNPKAIADLALEAGGFPAGPEYQLFNTQVIRRLADVSDFGSAVDFYRRISRNGDAVLASAEMTVDSTDPLYSPVTWQPYSLDGMNTNWVVAGDDQVQLAADLDSTFSGPIARKILTLGPGRYSLAVTHGAEEPGPFSRVTWRLTCPGARPRNLLDESRSLEERTLLRANFVVSSNCPMQMLTLQVTSGVETGSLNLLVGPVKLSRSN